MTRILVCVAVAVLAFVLGLALVRLVSPVRVVVTWETASEVGTGGFYLYRSESAEGPFLLLDETPVLATGDPLAGAAYHYEDLAVKWGKRYLYQLEEVEASGGRNRYPEVVEGRAGLGWTWALVIGIGFSLLGASLCWLIWSPRQPGEQYGEQS